MDFSGKDLEDIQRVAGLLNISVDELLQQSRARAQNPPPTNSPLSQLSPQTGSQQEQSTPFQGYPDSGALGFSDFQSISAGSEPTEFSLPPPITQSPETQVELLNPQTTWYDCDVAIWGYNQSGVENMDFNFEQAARVPGAGTESSYVPVTEMDIDSVSEEIVREEEAYESVHDHASSDWAIVSAPPDSPAVSVVMSSSGPSVSPTGSPFYKIAPKYAKPGTQSTSDSSTSSRVKKKRSAYEGSKRIATHLTRQLHACVRCRMQRNRRTVRMSRLPCLRYMVTDSTLFRTGLNYMPFYRAHPMIGPQYGDFHLDRQWTDAPSKLLCLGQIGTLHLKVELKEFLPPADTTDVDLKGRPMYAVPWAVADPEAVVEAMMEYIDRGMTRYMAAYLDDTDALVWNMFQAAYQASVFPLPNEMLRKTLRLWVACRFIESKWRCWSQSGWADNDILAMNPADPFYKDLDSLPPYIDYQIASIIIHRILGPLRKDVLRELQSTLNTHNPKDWFATFLTCFILLQNYEMQMLFQRQFAARREAQVQYLDMPLVRATNSGAKTILAHFHYCYKGQQLFTQAFDWNSPRVRRMARLDAEQTEFMAQCRDVVVKKAPKFQSINTTDAYHAQWWYTSQLFDHDWTPRETLEHAPPAAENPSRTMA
ncbi:hypothetical protein N0V88_008023 [Collariella sp. IMI 366227]|nr:hypothetical protein N0V88_008023 [Collariella sp. IMI 366227]